MRSPAEIFDRFRSAGMKVTPQREATVYALDGDTSHPTAEIVFERVRRNLSTVSLRTVYQGLNDLVELGEVSPVFHDGRAARFDTNTSPHDHFVCRSCNTIVDIISSTPELIGRCPEHDISGLTVETTEVVFRGLCESCR